MTIKPLLPQQEIFCRLYVKYWNGARAAREAGYSPGRDDETSYDLRQMPSVKKRIEELREEAMREMGITPERILKELSTIAYANMTDFATWNDSGVRFKSSDEISDDLKAAICEVTESVTNAGGTLRIKQHDKTKALELLGKYAKLFTDKQEISGPDGKAIEVSNVSEISDDQLDAKIKLIISGGTNESS